MLAKQLKWCGQDSMMYLGRGWPLSSRDYSWALATGLSDGDVPKNGTSPSLPVNLNVHLPSLSPVAMKMVGWCVEKIVENFPRGGGGISP